MPAPEYDGQGVGAPPLLASPIVTVANGFSAVSDVVVWPAFVPAIVGATGGSLSITVVALLTAPPGAGPSAFSVKPVVARGVGTPSTGVKTIAWSAVVNCAAVPSAYRRRRPARADRGPRPAQRAVARKV